VMQPLKRSKITLAYNMELQILPAYSHTDTIRDLFAEYTQMLINGDSTFREYLKLQNYEDELAHLEKKYGLPDGRLYLLLADGVPAGCIGLRKIDPITCELKRLYVKPQFRGHKLGELLVGQIIADAKLIGYHRMRLDTLPFLTTAIALYKRCGFYEIPQYLDSPMVGSLYMQLDL